MIGSPGPGAPLPTENKVTGAIDQVVDTGADPAEQAIDKAAEASVSWLSFPVVKQIFEALVSWIIGTARKTGEVLISFAVSRTEGTKENSDLVSADKEMTDALKSGDPARIAAAQQALLKAQSAAANTDGWAKPK
jgi:hypothetical protein